MDGVSTLTKLKDMNFEEPVLNWYVLKMCMLPHLIFKALNPNAMVFLGGAIRK